MNNSVEIELDGNFKNCILKADGIPKAELKVTNSELYLPIIELPASFESKFLKSQSTSFTKELTWDNLDVHVSANDLTRGAFDFEVTPSLPGVRQMYFVAIPVAQLFDQKLVFSITDCAIKNYNIVIDSEDFYSQNVRDDVEAYTNLSEMLSGSGDDVNTGNLLPFSDWKDRYRIYGADLSRQRIFESDPGKPQSIRLRGTLEREDAGRLRVIVILVQNKTTIIDFVNPFNTKTI